MKQALIWGGDGDIGRATAHQLADSQWQVAATVHNQEFSDGRISPAIYADVADAYSLQQAVMNLSQEINEVDLWLYTIGDIAFTRVADLSPDGWQRVLDANLNGAFRALHHSLPLLAADAHLFFVGALTEQVELPRLAAYAAAKAGLEAFVTVLAKEERKRKVTLIRPGAVATKFWDRGPAKLPKQHLQSEDVAQAILRAYEQGETGQVDLVA
jgi:NAD(P)-dependent dehydrogenase (short-subunit alcohol dehydrogenase family)